MVLLKNKRLKIYPCIFPMDSNEEQVRQRACMRANHFSCGQFCVTPWTVAARLLCPWDSPGKSTGVGCHALLQGIFPTQGLRPSLTSPALAGRFFTTSATWGAIHTHTHTHTHTYIYIYTHTHTQSYIYKGHAHFIHKNMKSAGYIWGNFAYFMEI